MVKLLLLLSLLIACTEQYNINSTCKESLIVGLYYSVNYSQDSTYAMFHPNSVEIGVGVYARIGDITREYKEFRTEWNNDILKLFINNRILGLRK